MNLIYERFLKSFKTHSHDIEEINAALDKIQEYLLPDPEVLDRFFFRRALVVGIENEIGLRGGGGGGDACQW